MVPIRGFPIAGLCPIKLEVDFLFGLSRRLTTAKRDFHPGADPFLRSTFLLAYTAAMDFTNVKVLSSYNCPMSLFG